MTTTPWPGDQGVNVSYLRYIIKKAEQPLTAVKFYRDYFTLARSCDCSHKCRLHRVHTRDSRPLVNPFTDSSIKRQDIRLNLLLYDSLERIGANLSLDIATEFGLYFPRFLV
jgi:hypothetical protein